MGKKSIKKIIFYSLPLFLSISFAFLLCEFLVRYFDLSKTWASYKSSITISQFMQTKENKTVGYKRIPNKSFVAPRNIIFETNNYGFRDKNFKIKKDKNTIRIAVIGDSVTEGFGVKANDRFTNYSEIKLNKQTNHNFEFFNFGISGHSTYDQLDILINDVLKFKPDYVLLQFGFNDIRKNKSIHDAQLSKTKPDAAERKKNTPGPRSNGSLRPFLQKNSALYLFFAEIYNTYKLNHNIPNSILYNVLSIKEDEWELTLNLLEEIAAQCKKHSIPFLITYLPLDVEIQIKDKKKGQFVNLRLKQFCQENNIIFIDVVNALRETTHSNLFLDDVHLSVAGNIIVGDVIAKHFAEIILR